MLRTMVSLSKLDNVMYEAQRQGLRKKMNKFF
jgi:hypothetical protein